jgi:hypothetical protein
MNRNTTTREILQPRAKGAGSPPQLAAFNTHWCGVPILPGEPTQPCPELLTEAEAIRYLRLDTIEIRNPSDTLRRYREQGMLRGTQVSKRIMYRRIELDRLLERLTERDPR